MVKQVEGLRNKLSPFINLVAILDKEGVGGVVGNQKLLDIVNGEIKKCKKLTPEIKEHLEELEVISKPQQQRIYKM